MKLVDGHAVLTKLLQSICLRQGGGGEGIGVGILLCDVTDRRACPPPPTRLRTIANIPLRSGIGCLIVEAIGMEAFTSVKYD